MLSLDQALESVLGAIVPLEAESCDLSSSHLRVLAADMVASNDIPPFDNASMDGYAVSADDTRPVSGPGAIELELQGEVGAGDSFASGIGAGKTVRILTGAMIPPGADAVIEQERVTVRDGRIRIEALVEKGRNIRRRGEDIRSGQTVLTKGSLVTSARVGVLASLGARSVPVFKTPRVAILTTGNELVDVDQPLEGGKIRDSNAYTLSALVRDAGCIPVMIGRAADSSSDLRTKLVAGLGCDALITSGGVSVGDRDLVLETLKQIGAEVRFWKVNIKPGMPFAFCLHLSGAKRPVPIFALPGNPVSTMVTFLQLVRPALGAMRGLTEPQLPVHVQARLEEDYAKSDGKRHFARGIVRNKNNELLVRKSGSQSSGVLTSMSVANCLIVIPEHETMLRAGSMVTIQLLGDSIGG